MTTFEHAMLGINGVLASGLPARHGWQLMALAGVAAAAPDWDGVPILFSVQLFNESHRVWGHNLLACLVLGLLIGGLDYRWDLITRTARGMSRLKGVEIPASQLTLRSEFSSSGLRVWLLTGTLAALSQLPADLLVSGTATLGDWELKLLWPFSSRGYVFPLVRWGDVVISLVFVAGMFALLRWWSRRRTIAICTLACVMAYMVLRGIVGY